MAGVQDQIDIVTEDGEQAGNHGCNGFEVTGSNPASLKGRQGSQSVSDSVATGSLCNTEQINYKQKLLT